MKLTEKIESPLHAGLYLVPVKFEFTDATAQSVAISGTFNDWHPTTKSMQPCENGLWLKEAYLPPGYYEYCLVVDGKYMADPRAKNYVPNTFGGMNSILTVAIQPDMAPRSDSKLSLQ